MSSASEALRRAVPQPSPPRKTKTVRVTDPTRRALPPSKIARSKPRINLADVLRPDPALPQNPPPPLPPLVLEAPAAVLEAAQAAVGRSAALSTAPMKHRIKTKSASEIYDAAEARRNKFNRKYINHCRKFGIPYPSVGVRETEHLNDCHTCQRTWPLFVYEQHYVCQHPMEDVTRAWCDLPEFERARLYRMLLQADRQWLKAMVKSRTASSFQLFVKDILNSQEDVRALKNIRERSARLSALWKSQTPEVIRSYEERAERLKVDRINQLTNLPEFKKKQVERARREYRRVLRESHPPKPPNPYILYQQATWQEEARKPDHMSYRDFVKLASQRWKNEVTEEEKQPYVDAAKVQRANYFVRRDAAVARLKEVKQQKRNANQTLAAQQKRRKGAKGQPVVLPDHGSDGSEVALDEVAPHLPLGTIEFPRPPQRVASAVASEDEEEGNDDEEEAEAAEEDESVESDSSEDDEEEEEAAADAELL